MTEIHFENLLKETIGLDPASVGRATVERAVRQRMTQTGLTTLEDYWLRLRDSNRELQELIETVVVPETWFFRDREAFVVLAGLIMERLPPSVSTSVVRLLSVPCSTGEEPYSMIMTLLDCGYSREQIVVDAVDVSARALARAQSGEYGSNSFRGDDLNFRERYFRSTTNGHCLPEEIRAMVNFVQANILFAGFLSAAEPYNVIFCRNLLIYFDRSAQGRVMKILERLLAPGGLLFVGPAETFLATCSGFRSVNRSMSFAFQKTAETEQRPAIQPRKITKKDVSSKARSVPTNQMRPAPATTASARPLMNLDTARSLADKGQLQNAAVYCERYLKQHGPCSEAYYLLGLVCDATGDSQRAAECYRKVIYLEPEHAEALLHLAILTGTHGDVAGAERLRERARRVEKGLIQE